MNKSLIRRKIFSVQHRINKRIYENRINLPFLSGDGFESICDYSAYSPKKNLVNQKSISSAKSIFCTSHNLETLIQDFGNEITANTLVLGNSDRDFYEFDLDLPDSINKVFLQNSHISNNFFKTLPIGLENLRLARNGIPALFNSSDKKGIKKYEILVGPFSPSHTERKQLREWRGINHNFLNYKEDYVSPKKLSYLSREFLFIACPRGNGTDTHRFWETLYRGSIPVVTKSRWSDSIKELGIPFVELSNWDFEELLQAVQDQAYESIKPHEIEALWINKWKKVFIS
jgi:hypothetical protein